jgi:hypothetical protein
MTSTAKMLLSAIAIAAVVATPALAKPRPNQGNLSHAPIAGNSTFLTVDSHAFAFDRDPMAFIASEHKAGTNN